LGLCTVGCYEGIDTHREVPAGTRDAETPECTALTAKHSLPILVISYLPSKDGVRLDAGVTGVDVTLDEMRARVDSMTAGTIDALQEGSRFRGYADRTAGCSIHYAPIDHVKYVEALPVADTPFHEDKYRPDYIDVLERENICKLVDEQGVREVWLWGYHHGNVEPTESNMAGPYGDISNSERSADMPVCKNTYTLYNYNYGRGVAEAVHNHGHQIENVMLYFDKLTFDNWRYPRAGGGVPSSCGDVHYPPNTAKEYEYDNDELAESDCLDWQPAAAGSKTQVSCANWGCEGDAQRNYLVWWMQNLPGLRNGLTHLGGTPVGNWWDAIADFDAVRQHGFQPEGGEVTGEAAQCDALGYEGTCFGDTSVWSEGGACRVRDCASEGRSCGWISDSAGWGCLGGTEGATTFDCSEVGYEGVCTEDDTLVWAGGNACNFIHCPDRGQSCGWDSLVGYDCVGEDDAEVESKAQCDALGYTGTCVGQTSVWSEDGTCRVRDCASEGRSCGFISDSAGWGCLGGTEGASTIDCGELGYTGTCTDDGTLVWVQDGQCRTSQCRDRGLSCGWDDEVGYNCV
jgi:hypothetical protein